MIAGLVGFCLLIVSLVTFWHHAPPVIAYDFQYHIVAPAALHGTQLFSGARHTYLVLPPGVTVMRAAFLRRTHKHPVTVGRDGPYWQLPKVAHAWRITTTHGLLTAAAWGPPKRPEPAVGPQTASPSKSVTHRPTASPSVPPLQAVRREQQSRAYALGFRGTHLTALGKARLVALRSVLLRHTSAVRLLAFSGRPTSMSRHRATRRAVIVAATLLRWGYRAHRIHIRVFTAHRAALEITFNTAHKDNTP